MSVDGHTHKVVKLRRTGEPNDFSFLRHSQDASNLSPGTVYVLDTEKHTSKVIYADSGKTISAASSALEIKGIKNGIKNRLFISQVFENFIVVCE